MSPGTLYLIPVPLAENSSNKSYTNFLRDTVNQIDEYIVENPKTARKFLKEAGIQIPQSELILHDYGKHQRDQDMRPFFKGLLSGKNVGLMSEAGCPGIADPGAEIVNLAHQQGIRVVPLVGPSSIILALMASGFSGQSFSFHGYLPIDKQQRAQKLKELEKLSEKYQQTQIFIETPFRNNAMLNDILSHCRTGTLLCIAAELTAEREFIRSMDVSAWKKNIPDLHKKPAIFLLYRK